MAKICKTCGTENLDNAIYCIECGSPFDEQVQKPTPQQPESEQNAPVFEDPGSSYIKQTINGVICVGFGLIIMILSFVIGDEYGSFVGLLLFFLSAAPIAISIPLFFDASFLKDKKKQYDQINARLQNIREQLQKIGVGVTEDDDALTCAIKFSDYSEQTLEDKFNKLKKQYGFDDYIVDCSSGIAFGKTGIVYEIHDSSYHYRFNNHPSIFDDENFISKVTENWDFDKKIKFVSYSDIEYFELEGEIHYDTEISGGGANIAGALKGGFLFGGAGAIVGSQIGTEITSSTKKTDSRILVIHSSNEQIDDIHVYCAVDSILYELRKIIPEKEYSYEQGYKTIKQNKNENGYLLSDNLIELKKLYDASIITQEEFDAKKKQLLGL